MYGGGGAVDGQIPVAVTALECQVGRVQPCLDIVAFCDIYCRSSDYLAKKIVIASMVALYFDLSQLCVVGALLQNKCSRWRYGFAPSEAQIMRLLGLLKQERFTLSTVCARKHVTTMEVLLRPLQRKRELLEQKYYHNTLPH